MKTKTRFYKLTAWLLTAVMLFTFMPMTTFAKVSHSHPICGAVHTDIGDHTGECADVEWTEWDGTHIDVSGNYYLNSTVNSSTNTYILIGSSTEAISVTLCLNGNTLNLGSYLTIMNATVNLCDCSSGKTGKIVGNNTYNYTIFQDGNFQTTLNMYGGSISGKSQYGAVFVDGSSHTFNMYCGNITNNYTGTYRTGAVCVADGEFNMYGGSISGYTGEKCSGIYAYGGATVTMEDGAVIENNASASAVYLSDNSSAFTMNGGSISVNGTNKDSNVYGIDNSGTVNIYGGTVSTGSTGNAIYSINNKGTVNVCGGTVISGKCGINNDKGTVNVSSGTVRGGSINATDDTACGIYHYGAFLNLSGNPTITGSSEDIRLTSDKVITIGEDGLSNASPYTVATNKEPTESAPVPITSGTETVDYSGKFVSADSNYVVNSVQTGSTYQVVLAEKPTAYAITVSASPDYAGEVAGGGRYEAGDLATVTATANFGYKFIKWTKNGIDVSPDEFYAFTATEDTTLVAVFERETGNLTVKNTVISSVTPADDVEFPFTVTLSDNSINGTYGGMLFTNGVATFNLKGGQEITASNLPAGIVYEVSVAMVDGFILTDRVESEGYILEGNATASFTHTQQIPTYTVNVSASPDYAGEVTGDGIYEAGDLATVTATANAGYKFVEWMENGTEVSTDEFYTFTVSADRELVAVFEEKETLTIDETVQNYTYDSNDKAFVITGTSLTDFTVIHQQNGQEVTPKNVGTYDVVITRYEDDTYKKFEMTITGGLVINKATPSVTAPTAKTDLIYDGNEKTLVNAGATSGGEMQYSLDEATWSTALPQGNAAGSYTVYYKVVGGNNYNDNAGGSVLVTIGEADMSAGIVAYGYTGDYDDENHTISVALSGAAEGATVKYGTVDGTYNLAAAPVYKYVTTSTVYYQVTKANYVTITGSQAVTINPKDITGADVGTFMAMTYTGFEQIPTATVTIDGLTVTGTWSAVTDVADTTTFTANGNFIGTIADKETGMAMADSSVATVPGANALTYNAAAQELLTAGTATGGTLKYSLDNTTWVEAIPTGTDADTYEVWYKVFGDANHNDTAAVKVDVTIAKKSIEDATVALDGELTYNGTEQTQNVIVSLDGFTVTFDVTGNKATNVKAEGNYVLTITGTNNFTGTATKEWNLLKATHAIFEDELPDAKYMEKGKPLSKSTLTPVEFYDEDGNLLGTFEWENPDEIMEESGTYLKNVKFIPVNALNYNEQIFEISVRVFNQLGSISNDDTRYFNIQFESNGGSYVKIQNIEEGYRVTEPDEPVKEGYVFGGWYTNKKLTDEYDFGDRVTEGFTLYAKWNMEENEEKPDDSDDSGDKVGFGDDECDGTVKDNCPSLKFKDLNVSAWYHLDTDYVIRNGLMKGMSEDEFAPSLNLTRAMLVTVLYRLEGEPATNRSIPFADVDMGAYYANAVSWAKQNGIVMGVTENEFAPDDNITREQIAAILFRYSIYKGMDAVTMEENLHFDDAAEISEYAISALNWAVGRGLLKGRTETTLNPKELATRAEIAAILHRFIESK